MECEQRRLREHAIKILHELEGTVSSQDTLSGFLAAARFAGSMHVIQTSDMELLGSHKGEAVLEKACYGEFSCIWCAFPWQG